MIAVDGLPLARPAFDRAAHRRNDEAWLAAAWRALGWSRSARSPRPPWSSARTAPRTSPPVPRLTSPMTRRAGSSASLTATEYFTVTVPSRTTAGPGRRCAISVPAPMTSTPACSSARSRWSSGISGTRTARCAARRPSRARRAGHAPAPSDGSEHFPRTDPAVIMLIHDGGDRALLGRGHEWGEGRFSTLAGFVEPGESLEAAVAREVFEEVGVGVTDIRYLASQPWPFPASLMIGFVARLDGDPAIDARSGRDGRGSLVHPGRDFRGARLDRRRRFSCGPDASAARYLAAAVDLALS